MFLVTNALGLDWRLRQWGPEISFSEENENYQFCVYSSPGVARYMQSFFEGEENPLLWECSGKDLTSDEGIRKRYASLHVSRPVGVSWPSPEKKIIFGILCALNVVESAPFHEWANQYLLGKDAGGAYLLDGFGPAAGALTLDPFRCICAAHAAFWLGVPLEDMVGIVETFPPEEIARLLN